MTAGTGFIGSKGSGLTGTSSHEDEDLYQFSAMGTFYFREPGGVFSFVTTIQQHGYSSRVFSFILPQGFCSCKKSNR